MVYHIFNTFINLLITLSGFMLLSITMLNIADFDKEKNLKESMFRFCV